ncbi:MAG: histidine kinase [Micrococcus sp.]|nr:histidine kinase [Micrococcus sp.]
MTVPAHHVVHLGPLTLTATPVPRAVRIVTWIFIAWYVAMEVLFQFIDAPEGGTAGWDVVVQVATLFLFAGLITLHPIFGTLVFLAVLLGGAALWAPHFMDLELALAAYLVGLSAHLALGLLVASGFVVWFLLVGLIHGGWPPTGTVQLIAVLIAAALGLATRALRARLRASAERAAAQRAQEEQAQAEIRRGIAADLHDVVGHGLTVVAMHAAVLSTSRDADAARETRGVIREATAQARVDLQHMVTELASAPDDGVMAPDSGGLSAVLSVDEMLERYASRLRSAGFDTEATADVETTVPSSLMPTVHRLIQEGSTNVLKHAQPPARVHLAVTVTPDAVTVTVRNTLHARAAEEKMPASGFGITGLEERVRVFGGDLEIGPQGVDWVLDAHIPFRRTP